MRVNENLIGAMSAVIIFGVVGVANAQTGETRGAQGLESVDKNLNRDPDSHGLTNAQTHIQDNMAERKAPKKAAHRTAHKVDRDRDAKGMRVEKAERMDRPARPDHPERPGR